MRLKLYGKELSEKLEMFNNKNVTVMFDDYVEGKFYMKNIKVIYKKQKSYLYITGEDGQEIKINMALVSLVDLENETLHINLECSIDIYMSIID